MSLNKISFLMWIIGCVLIFAVYVALLYNAITIAGGDLGLSVSHAKDFYDLAIKYTWNHFVELGMPNLGILWYPYYTFISLVSFVVNTKILTIISFSMPLIVSFSLIYWGTLELLHDNVFAFFAGLIFVFNPLSTRVYLMIPLHPTYSVLVYAAFFVYMYFLLMFSRNLKKWKLILATIIAWPFMLITFSQPAYGLAVTVAGLFSILLAMIATRYRFNVTVKILTICLVIVMLLSMPFILVYLPLSSTKASTTLPEDVGYIVRYTKVESSAINFFENFFPVSGNLFIRILIILTSLLILSISFIIPAINLRKLTWECKVTYLAGTILFIIGVLLSKGINPPLEKANELIYKTFAPYSFIFRSPYSKFSIITIVGLIYVFTIALKVIEKNLYSSDKYRYKLKYVFTIALITITLLISFATVKNYYNKESLLVNGSNLEIFQSLVQLKYALKDDGRIIMFPINYGVFSTYNTSRSYYRGAANEWILLKTPIIVNNNWDKNQYIRELLLSLGSNNKTTLSKLILLGNVKYFDYIFFKESDKIWNDVKIFNNTVELLQARCYIINNTQLCNSPLHSSYFYIVEGNDLKSLHYNYIDPTYWTVSVNSPKPFILAFAESYDPLWEARVYKDGKLVEKVKSIPLYGVINGFWINETGNLEITIRYTPQDWFELGLKISAITFALCIFYLVWDWKRGKSNSWAVWLNKFVKYMFVTIGWCVKCHYKGTNVQKNKYLSLTS